MDDDFDDQDSYASVNDNSFQNILRDSRISNMTEESIFFERLYQTSQKRLLNFKEKYQNDFFFMDEEKFKNIFVDEEATYYHSPFSAIFHYCFNPSTNLPNSGKSFFETIFQKRGDKDYSISYRKDELQDIPKFFDDISYSNNLFDNFDISDLLKKDLLIPKINLENFIYKQYIHSSNSSSTSTDSCAKAIRT